MGRDRRELHEMLVSVLGSPHVYFQPPSNVQMVYPAIIYERDADKTEHANDVLYSRIKRYNVLVIDKDPDSPIPDKVAQLPYVSFARHYKSANLNHDAFTIYF